MAAYLVTHSLLSSWLHLIRENPYEDLTHRGRPAGRVHAGPAPGAYAPDGGYAERH